MEVSKDPFIIQKAQYVQMKALKQGSNGKSYIFKSKVKKRKSVFKFVDIRLTPQR